MDRDQAVRALKDLLWELPAEFNEKPGTPTRHQFTVIKQNNVRKVHEALWKLQEYFSGESMKVWVYRSRNNNHAVFSGDCAGFDAARSRQDDDNFCTLDDLDAEGIEWGGSCEQGHFYIDEGGSIELFEVLE